MPGMETQAPRRHEQAPGTTRASRRNYSGAGFSRMRFTLPRPRPARASTSGWPRPRRPATRSTATPTSSSKSRARRSRSATTRRVEDGLFDAILGMCVDAGPDVHRARCTTSTRRAAPARTARRTASGSTTTIAGSRAATSPPAPPSRHRAARRGLRAARGHDAARSAHAPRRRQRAPVEPGQGRPRCRRRQGLRRRDRPTHRTPPALIRTSIRMFSNLDLQQLIFGRLTLEAVPYHEPILVVTFAVVALGGIGAARRASPSTACGAICGANGSPASTTRRSASCT